MGCGAVQSVNHPTSVPTPLKQPYNLANQQKYSQNQQTSKIDKIQQKSSINKAYIIKQLIGKGTYGKVYRCIKRDTHQQFALKIVKLNAKNKQEAERHIKNLKSQISVLKKLNHSNIIKYYTFDVSSDSQSVEIVFQLVQEGSLKNYIDSKGPLSQEIASKICKQILQALDYLHQKSIIHRDLKCANILITEDQIVKITDFGTAKQIKIKTNQDIAKLCASLKGTPYYMAPEILKRSGHHKSADIWSFGCTLIEMLTGKAPWTTLTQNFEEIISYIISGIHPPLPPKITKQCEFFLQSCFDSIPSQRLTSKQLLNHRFISKYGKLDSLVYQTVVSPKISIKSKHKNQQVQILDLNSIEITQRKRSIDQTEQKKTLNARYEYQASKTDKKSIKNSFQNENFEPVSKLPSQIQISKDYKKLNARKNVKKPSKVLKTNAKTAGNFKMTEQNLLDMKNESFALVQQNSFSKNLLKGNSKFKEENTNGRLRSHTQNTIDQQDQVISTTLAKEQRLIYLQAKNRLQMKKQEQRRKWEQELKKERDFIQLQKKY